VNGDPRILLVDDNFAMLETLSDILRASGFAVDTAGDGAGATRLMRANRYDAAVIDILLPDANGVELAKRFQVEYPQTGVAVITAYTESLHVTEARAAGIKEILMKPLDPDALLAALRRLTSPAEPVR
jgi:DNA-binding response OmpR family regulator